MRHILTALLTLVVAGCGAESESDSGAGTPSENKSTEAPTFGKTDAAFGVVEAGRFGVAGSAEGRFDGSAAQSYRVNGDGNTRVRVSLTSPGVEVDSYIVIDGPMPGGDGQVVAYSDGDVRGDTLDSYIELTLEKPGTYRLLAGTNSIFQGEAEPGGAFVLDYACLENCAMPQVTLRDLVAGIVAQLGESQAAAALEAGVDQMFPDAPTATAVKAQVAAYLADPSLEAFPSLPLNLADTAQGFFEADEVAPPAPEIMHFDVEAILTQGCTASRSELKHAFLV